MGLPQGKVEAYMKNTNTIIAIEGIIIGLTYRSLNGG